jgi:hypothetical protein
MTTIRLVAALMAASVGAAMGADETPPAGWSLGGYTLGGWATAGYRLVDIDGSKDKYREDYNLRSGGRLFDVDLEGVASEPDARPLDRFHLRVETPGDEPVSTFLLTANDARNWDFRASVVRSKYYYAVPQLFESPVPGDSRLDDLHDFDQIRTNGTVDLTLRRPNLPTVFPGYRLYRLEGDTTSTVFDPTSGDTFVVRAPEDTRAHVGRIGTEFEALGTGIFLQQEYRRVIRDLGDHGPTPGGAAGLDPADDTTLARYDAFGEEHIDAPTTVVRLRRAFGPRVEVAGSYLYGHAELDADWTTARAVTTGGTTTRDDTRTAGDASLDTHVADLRASLLLTSKARLSVTYRFDERAQDGGLDEQSRAGPGLLVATGHHVRLHRVTGDAVLEPSRDLSLRAGVRYAWRDANLSSGVGPVSTGTIGAIGDVRWRPMHAVDLFARYEAAQVDDPYATAGDPSNRPPLPGRETELTFRNRGSAGTTLRPWSWATLAYRFVADSRENSSFDARSLAFGQSVALTFVPRPNLTILASYARRDLDNQADILFAPRWVRDTSLQQGSEDVVVSQLTWDFGLGGQRWTTGWTFYWVASDETLRPRFEADLRGRTRFDLDRVDGGAFLTWRHSWLEPTVEVRRIEYTQEDLTRNDYDATIVTLKLTKRFGDGR